MKKIVVLIGILSLFLVSCRYDISETAESNVTRNSERRKNLSRSMGGVDMTPFFDVTLKNVCAEDVSVDEFFEIVKGNVYKSNDTVLRFNGKKKNVSVNIAGCDLPGYENANINFSYDYDLKAASDNLVYICPKDYRTVKVNVNGEYISGKELGQFRLYFSVYGFGESRIEVSYHLNKESFIKGNTYWNR